MTADMAPTLASTSEYSIPDWFDQVMGFALPRHEDEAVDRPGYRIAMRAGIPRVQSALSDSQAQTKEAFSFIWGGEDRFQSEESLKLLSDWYRQMYGDVANAPWWSGYAAQPVLLDGGCGAGLSAIGLFGERLKKVKYLGVDVSSAVEAAARRFAKQGIDAAFLQASIVDLPIPERSVDVVFSQGVMHHTDSTRAALFALAKKLRRGGRFLFYVYKKKGPIREFTDDYIRDRLQALSPQEAWDALLPLTKLGQYLGDLKIEIDVPEAIDVLQIPAGKIDLQRLFYWHIFKAFHQPSLSLDELTHINLDWYAPINAHRQTPEDVRAWCAEAALEIEREHLELSGIAIVARKTR